MFFTPGRARLFLLFVWTESLKKEEKSKDIPLEDWSFLFGIKLYVAQEKKKHLHMLYELK